MNALRSTFCCIFAVCLFSGTGMAQDKIVKRDGDIVECKVLKIGSEVITYNLSDSDIDVEFEIDISKVDRIIFSNGAEHVIDHAERARESAESNSADLFLVQKKKTIEWNFTSVFGCVTELGFEKALKPGKSFEANIGIIGLGFDLVSEYEDEGKPFGIGFKAGYKFMRSPDFYMSKMRYSHILKGAYVKPEIAFASYGGGYVEENITKGALMITFGNQTVYSDQFLVDIFYSIGFGISNEEVDIFSDGKYFSVAEYAHLAQSFGMRIGLLF